MTTSHPPVRSADPEREKQLKFATWVGIVCNLLLTLLKGAAGIIGNSSALIADALHSASDVITSVVVLIGVNAALKPPDSDHPYGHGKAEVVAAIIVSVLLAVVAIELFLGTLQSMREPADVPEVWTLYIVLISVLVKEMLFRYKRRVGLQMNSQALVADAWHHRSDALSSIAVLIGVGLALMADTFQVEWFIYADPVAGMVISLMILYVAWEIGYEAVHRTLDHTLHREDTEGMRRRVTRIQGVMSIDSFRAREHGPYLIIDIKISVSADLSVEQGHVIAKRVKQELMKISEVEDVLVHVNPHQPDEPSEAG